MAITILDLPQSAEYALLREKEGKKERIKNYINTIVSKYPNTKDRTDQFWKDHQGEYDKLTDLSPDSSFEKFFSKYDGEQDLINIIKPEVIKQIDELLTIKPTDSEIVKELKEIYDVKGHKNLIPDFLSSSSGGVSYLNFLVDLIEDYYLQKAPAYINKELTDNDVKLSELDKEQWMGLKDELFVNVYSSFSDDKGENDLDETIKGINKVGNEIKKLIITTRDNNAEDIPTLKEKLSKSEKRASDLEIANKILLKTIKDIIALRANEQRAYVVIDNPDASLYKITEILTNLKKEWSEHLDDTKESTLLRLALKTEEKIKRANEILDKVKNTAETMEGYKELEQFWNNGKSEYDDTDDYDGKLYQLRELLKTATTKN